MIAHLWQSTIFALAIALLTPAFRNNPASVRFCLWLSASLKFLFPFALLIGLGNHVEPTRTAQKIATPEITFAVQYLAEPIRALPRHTDWQPAALICIWMLGGAALTISRLRSWRRVRAIVRSSVPLQICAGIEIRSSGGLLEPGAVGILRPIVLLPEGIEQSLTPSQLEAVIAHELCHVERRDNLLAAMHMLVEIVFWFHPLVWFIGARLIEERERACDEAVLKLGAQPGNYAEAIVGVCRLYTESPLTCVSGVTGGTLLRRIEAIMENRTGTKLNRAQKVLLATAATFALSVPIAIGLVLGVPHLPTVHAQTTAPPSAPSPIPASAPKKTSAQQERRLTAMLFDLAGMTPDGQTRTRQAAIDYVKNFLKPAEVVAVLSSANDKVTIAQDFTSDAVLLEAAILRLPIADAGVPAIESAAGLLAVFPEKKSLMFYSAASMQPNAPGLQSAIDAAKKANMAIFPINPGPADNPVGRIYLKRYGPPDTIDNSANRQIWRYNDLESFRGKAEFEFSPPNSVRINWPPPTAIFTSAHGTMQTYPASASQILSISLASLSGDVKVYGIIQGGTEAAFSDQAAASTTPYQTSFILPAGSYVCAFSAKEAHSDRFFAEIINFEVK